MLVIVLVHNADKNELETVQKWIKVLETKKEVLLNIPVHRLEDHIQENSIIITFGKVAEVTATQCVQDNNFTNNKVIILPAISKLVRKEENKEHRQQAYNKLCKIKELLAEDMFFPTATSIKETDIPELNTQQLLMLEKITEEKGKKSWYQVLKDKRIIEISLDKKENSKADIHITFSELYTIRAIMDTLEVKEVKIISEDNGESNEKKD